MLLEHRWRQTGRPQYTLSVQQEAEAISWSILNLQEKLGILFKDTKSHISRKGTHLSGVYFRKILL